MSLSPSSSRSLINRSNHKELTSSFGNISKNSKFTDESIETIAMDSYANLCVIESDKDYNQLFVISSSDKMRPNALKTLTNKNIREACISIYKYYQSQNKVKMR